MDVIILLAWKYEECNARKRPFFFHNSKDKDKKGNTVSRVCYFAGKSSYMFLLLCSAPYTANDVAGFLLSAQS